MDAWKVMLSVGTPAGTGRVNLDIDAVVSQVLKRIPSHTGETYTVAPMEALKLDWQKDGMDRMYEAIDGLGDMSIRVISYMILLDKRTTGSNIAQALLGNRHGTSRNTISKAMAPLKTMFFVKATKNGFVQDIVGFVEHHLGYATEDITPFVDRVLERIRTRNGGD
jgi:hypothetical protein